MTIVTGIPNSKFVRRKAENHSNKSIIWWQVIPFFESALTIDLGSDLRMQPLLQKVLKLVGGICPMERRHFLYKKAYLFWESVDFYVW